MEMHKLNVLHWHIVDDESFAFVSESMPELSAKGAYEPVHHVYRKKDVESVVEYARQRAIRVLMEFDTPGHVRSWGYSQGANLLTECYGKNGKPNGDLGPIDPTKESAYQIITKLFTELANRFPFEQYLHLGGDEVSFDCWISNPAISQFMAAHNMTGDYKKLESYYIQRLLKIVTSLGKNSIVWQEVFDNHAMVEADTVVHVWKLPDNPNGRTWQDELKTVLTHGYKALASSPWYLDLIKYGQQWQEMYTAEPMAAFKDDAEANIFERYLLGGEACLWAEFINGANLETMAWPRAAAFAERMWSRREVNSTQEAEVRFQANSCRLMTAGVRVEPQLGNGRHLWCPCDYLL